MTKKIICTFRELSRRHIFLDYQNLKKMYGDTLNADDDAMWGLLALKRICELAPDAETALTFSKFMPGPKTFRVAGRIPTRKRGQARRGAEYRVIPARFVYDLSGPIQTLPAFKALKSNA
jgi:hypothetical protein